jgi:hypothetical protein
MCNVLLPPGGNPIAVKYIISYHLSYIIYHIVSYIISCHVISYNIISYISYHISYHVSYHIKEEQLGGVRWSKTAQGQRGEDNGHREMWTILVLVEKDPL